MKGFLKKYGLTVIISVAGILGGYLYWRFVGCRSGTCAITANWYTSSIAGGVIGYLAGDSLNDFLKKRKNR
jgi:hypothetical protein